MNKSEPKGNRGVRQQAFQELDTNRRLNLGLTVLVLDNRRLRMAKNLQGAYFDRGNKSTVIGYGHPDFAKVARAFGVKARKVTSVKESQKVLREGKGQSHPMLIDVETSLGGVSRPRLLFGRQLD